MKESRASTVWVTHGFSNIVARQLTELGLDATPLDTQFRGETEEMEELKSEMIEQSNAHEAEILAEPVSQPESERVPEVNHEPTSDSRVVKGDAASIEGSRESKAL